MLNAAPGLNASVQRRSCDDSCGTCGGQQRCARPHFRRGSRGTRSRAAVVQNIAAFLGVDSMSFSFYDEVGDSLGHAADPRRGGGGGKAVAEPGTSSVSEVPSTPQHHGRGRNAPKLIAMSATLKSASASRRCRCV